MIKIKMKIKSKLCLACVCFILIPGCTSIKTDPRNAFSDVQDSIYQKTGRQICWDQSDHPSYEYNCWLNEILQQDLDIDQVIEIALINNYRLKARYHKLGIAKADLVQAHLFKNPIFSASLKYKNLVDSANLIDLGHVENFFVSAS